MDNKNNTNDIQRGKNILEIIYLEKRKIRLRISQSYKTESLSSYIENKIDLEDIEGSIREINGYLRKGNIFRNPDPQHFKNRFTEFQKACRLLHNELLSPEIKSSLQNSSYKDLEFILDAQLLHIPWELLFDGERFLCERFNTGRKIRIKEREINHSRDSEEITSPLRMLIIADPTEDLELAYKEGKRISNLIKKSQKGQTISSPDFHAYEMVTKDFIKKNLSDYDIIHYAGHVEYDPAQPQKGGWVLSDGILSAEDVLKMINTNANMPCLIFVNACQSGNWPKKQPAPDAPYPFEGLVYAFMKTGVKYYIGTFSEVPDEYGSYMGLEFYKQLLQGNSIGESLKNARESFQETYGTESLAWINYMLYGDPGDHIIKQKKTGHTKTINQTAASPDEESLKDSEKLQTRGDRFPSPFDKKWFWPFLFFLAFLTFLIFSYSMIKTPGPGPINVKKDHVETKDERVERFMNAIYQKLKERKERQPSPDKVIPQADTWTSRPQTIALFEIIHEPEELPGWVKGHIMNLRRKIAKQCNEGKRLRVVERDELDKLLREYNLELVDLPLKDALFKNAIIELLFAEKMLFLEVFKSGDDVCLWYKLDDVRKGESFNMDSSVLTKKEDLSAFAKKIYNQIENEIHIKYPLRGRIAKVLHNNVTLNIGSDVGVKKGDLFEIFGDPNITEEKRKVIGRIEVMPDGLYPKETQCNVLIGDDLLVGQRVEISKNYTD